MLFSSPSKAKQLLSLDLRPKTTTIFLFSSPFPFGLLSRPKNVTIINYNTKTAAVLRTRGGGLQIATTHKKEKTMR
jgi:hypothetical protein